MKIVILSPYLKIAGGTRILAMYAHYLHQLSHDVVIVVESRNCLRRFVSNLINFKPKWIRSLDIKILRAKSLDEVFIPTSDIILFSAWSHAFLASKYSDKISKKFYLIQHDERMYHGETKEVQKTYEFNINKIAVSSWLKEIMKNKLGDAELLLNPIDKNIFKPIKVNRNLNEVRILMMHHSYSWKGTEEGIKIVQDLKKKYSNIKLILFGVREKKLDFSYDEYYYNLPQEKLPLLYSGSDIYLCPSWDEGSGLPSMEAMACKCALVTYDNGGSRDYALNEKTAMVAKRKDVNDLKNKLELLVKDTKLREKISEGGYKFIQKMPSWEEQAKKLENIFKKELNENT